MVADHTYAIELKNVTKRYNELTAVNNLNLDINKYLES